MIEQKNLGRKSIPESLLEDRREYTVGLKLAGMSSTTILKQVNALSPTKGWGEVTRQTVDRDIAAHFRKNRALNIQDYDHLEQMRSALLAQVELNIEKMAFHIANKKEDEWKPFEKADSLEKIHKMRMDYAELQNWNLGRKNPLIAIQQNNINNIFDAAVVDLENTKPSAIRKLENLIDDTIAQLKEEDVQEAEEDIKVNL